MNTASRPDLRAWRRLGLAAWLSLALHAALIGTVQVSPRSAPPMGQWIEARLQPEVRPVLQPLRPHPEPANEQPKKTPLVRAVAQAGAADSGPAQSAPLPSLPAQAAPAEEVSASAEPFQRAPLEGPRERAPTLQRAISSAVVPLLQATPVQATPVQAAPVQSSPVPSSPVPSSPVPSSPVPSSPVPSSPVPSSPVQAAAIPLRSAQVMSFQPAPVRTGPIERTPESRPNNPEASWREPAPALDVPLLAEGRYYAAKELDVPPRPLHKIEPAYPPEYERRGFAGQVVLEIRIETDGQVSDLKVIETSAGGYEAFEREALAALRKARFAPARRGGQSVRALLHVRVIFEPPD